jgi:threonine synthase
MSDYTTSFGAVGLGEGAMPMIASKDDPNLFLKLEYLNPTGSFKDRGAAASVARALANGVRRIVVDSSGNAGAAMAAYAARADLGCDVFVPASNSRSKLKQIELYGACLHTVEGPREAARDAALEYSRVSGAIYLSHAHDDAFIDGVATCFEEIFEAFGAQPPQRLYLPAGHGTLVVSAQRVMQSLIKQGKLTEPPQLVAVQSSRCAPLAQALGVDVRGPVGAHTAHTPEGVLIAQPPRLSAMVQAIEFSNGSVRVLQDAAVAEAQRALLAQGLLVEATGALGFAAAIGDRAAGYRGVAVTPLCGAGLKTLLSGE